MHHLKDVKTVKLIKISPYMHLIWDMLMHPQHKCTSSNLALASPLNQFILIGKKKKNRGEGRGGVLHFYVSIFQGPFTKRLEMWLFKKKKPTPLFHDIRGFGFLDS